MKLQQFLQVVPSLSNDAIYDLYYDDDELCFDIYTEAERLGVVLADHSEPMRASLTAIGLHHNVQVLANW